MARTFRRRGCDYDYPFPLWRFDADEIIARIPAVRRQLARFHSDKPMGFRPPPPRGFRRVDDRKQRRDNRQVLRRWCRDPTREPLFADHRRCPAWMPM
ncbi:hypothetical protein ACIPL1_25740 [Pseudomonas sp. NPDC090202]|uniref:hypothetical protein n=1 Tax=unclassified Pseudomonas TaxID=196821 RepID=UPI003816A74F